MSEPLEMPAAPAADAGLLLAAAGDDEALLELKRQLAAAPEDISALTALAARLRDARRTEEASAAYARILRYDAHNANAHLGLAWIARNRGEAELAGRHFTAAITALRAHEPGDVAKRMQLAAALRETGSGEEASRIYQEVLAADPKNRAARAGLGWVALARQDEPAAILHFKAATASGTPDLNVAKTLARLLAKSGEREAAMRELQALAAAHGKNAELSETLGDLASSARDWPEAAQHYRDALPHAARRRDVALKLLKCEVQSMHWAAAETICQALLAAAPGDPEALFNLGEINEARGDAHAALAFFERAAAAAPFDFRPKRKLRLLRIVRGAHDWKAEIEEAIAAAQSPDAGLSAHEEAATILVEFGLVELAKPLLARLHAVSPIARSLALAVRQMERMGLAHPSIADGENADGFDLEALTGFIDKPAAGAPTLMIVFGGTNNRLWMTFSLLHRLLRPLGISVIYARDLRQDWYHRGVQGLGDDFQSSVTGLRHIAERHGARRLLALGNCVGCLAALRFGIALGAEGVLGLGPKIRPSEVLTPVEQRAASEIIAQQPAGHRNVRAQYLDAARPPRATLIYGENCLRDKAEAQYMAGLPSVTTIGIPHSDDTDTVKELLIRGLLGPLLAGFATSGEVSQDLRARILNSAAPGLNAS